MIHITKVDGSLITSLNICNTSIADSYSLSEAFLPKYGQVKVNLLNGSLAQTFTHPYYQLISSDWFDLSSPSLVTLLHQVGRDSCFEGDTFDINMLGTTFRLNANISDISIKTKFDLESLKSHLLPINDRLFAPTTVEEHQLEDYTFYDYSSIEITTTHSFYINNIDAAVVYAKVLSCQTTFGVTSSLDYGDTSLPIKITLTSVTTTKRSMFQRNWFIPDLCDTSLYKVDSTSSVVNNLVRRTSTSVYKQSIGSSLRIAYDFDGGYPQSEHPLHSGFFPSFYSHVGGTPPVSTTLDILASSIATTSEHIFIPTEAKFTFGDLQCIVTYEIHDLGTTSSTNNCKTYIQ